VPAFFKGIATTRLLHAADNEQGMILMSNDPKVLAAELDRIVERLRRLERADDVIDDIRNGGLLTTAQAATNCEVSGQTICRWNEDAARSGEPLGVMRVTWLISTARLLDYVEKYQGGMSARLKAETLLKEHWPIWFGPQGL
jgi:hypothetical protein